MLIHIWNNTLSLTKVLCYANPSIYQSFYFVPAFMTHCANIINIYITQRLSMIFLLKVSDDQHFRFCQYLGSPRCLLLQVTLSRFQKVIEDGVMKSVEFPDFTSFPFLYTHKHTSDMNHSSGTKDRKIVLLSRLGKKQNAGYFRANLPL